MDRAMRLMFAGGLTMLLAGLGFMVYLASVDRTPPRAAAGTGTTGGSFSGPPLAIPAFKLVDQNGEARDQAILEGRVSVVWFMFTNCPLACPAMSVKMTDLQRKVGRAGVQFVAFSIDPVHDTPEVLKAYGEKFGVDWSGWTFLTEPAGTPPKGIARAIYADDLKQYVEDTPANPIKLLDGTGSMANIEHAVNFFLVGPDGKIVDRGWFNANRAEEMEQLRERALGAVQYFQQQGRLKKAP